MRVLEENKLYFRRWEAHTLPNPTLRGILEMKCERKELTKIFEKRKKKYENAEQKQNSTKTKTKTKKNCKNGKIQIFCQKDPTY